MIKNKNTSLIYILVIVLVFSVFAYSGEKAKEEMLPGHTEKLAEYIAQSKYSDFPAEVITRAKYLIMDHIGSMLGASQTKLGKKYLALGKNINCGSTECTILGSGEKVSRETALYVHGLLVSMLSFGDNFQFHVPNYPGVIIMPVSLSFGEALGASGKDFLTAVILAYEACCHIGSQSGNDLWMTHFCFPRATGLAVVLAKLQHMDAQEVADVIRGAGIYHFSLGRQKKDQASNKGIARMIRLNTIRDIINLLNVYRSLQELDREPFLLDWDSKKWFLAGGSLENYDKLTSQLGKTYRILDLGFSPVPAPNYTHAAVTALLTALDNGPVKEEDVEEIIVKGVVRLDHPDWGEDMFEAQYSMYCVLALTALGVEPGPQWYMDGRFDKPDVRSLAKKIKLVNDPEAEILEMHEKIKCSVQVKFKDGSVKEATIHNVKGMTDNPLSAEEHLARFRANTRGIFDEAQVNRVINAIMNLEKVHHLSELTKLLVSPKLPN